jgi:hypothetical protein
MRTQNPPPVKACRFDSDLGHHSNSRLICLAGVYARCRNRRSGLLMCFNLTALAEAVTHSLHIKSAADVAEPEGGRRSAGCAPLSMTQVRSTDRTKFCSKWTTRPPRRGVSNDPQPVAALSQQCAHAREVRMFDDQVVAVIR